MTRCAIAKIEGEEIHGLVYFSQASAGAPVSVTMDLEGFHAEQVHAIHIHEYGDLREGCKSLGAHWNPSGVNHGHAGLTATSHAGDLMNNIISDPHGVVRTQSSPFRTSALTLFGDDSILGRSVVIHQSPDDLGLLGIPFFYNFSKEHPPPVLPYRNIPDNELRTIIRDRALTTDGLILDGTRDTLVRFFEKGSLTTGNAGKRLACGIIARCPSV